LDLEAIVAGSTRRASIESLESRRALRTHGVRALVAKHALKDLDEGVLQEWDTFGIGNAPCTVPKWSRALP
jgi:hypothetical protein